MFKKEYLERFIFAGIVGIILVGLLIYQQAGKQKALGIWGDSYRIASVTSSTTIGLVLTNGVASSTQILAANESRSYALCRNTNEYMTSSVPVSIMFGSTATTSQPNALAIWPAGTTSSTANFLVIDKNNPFTGAVYAYASATSSIKCVEN